MQKHSRGGGDPEETKQRSPKPLQACRRVSFDHGWVGKRGAAKNALKDGLPFAPVRERNAKNVRVNKQTHLVGEGRPKGGFPESPS